MGPRQLTLAGFSEGPARGSISPGEQEVQVNPHAVPSCLCDLGQVAALGGGGGCTPPV